MSACKNFGLNYLRTSWIDWAKKIGEIFIEKSKITNLLDQLWETDVCIQKNYLIFSTLPIYTCYDVTGFYLSKLATFAKGPWNLPHKFPLYLIIIWNVALPVL